MSTMDRYNNYARSTTSMLIVRLYCDHTISRMVAGVRGSGS